MDFLATFFDNYGMLLAQGTWDTLDVYKRQHQHRVRARSCSTPPDPRCDECVPYAKL